MCVQIIAAWDTWKLIKEKQAKLIDLRPKEEYEKNHIFVQKLYTNRIPGYAAPFRGKTCLTALMSWPRLSSDGSLTRGRVQHRVHSEQRGRAVPSPVADESDVDAVLCNRVLSSRDGGSVSKGKRVCLSACTGVCTGAC